MSACTEEASLQDGREVHCAYILHLSRADCAKHPHCWLYIAWKFCLINHIFQMLHSSSTLDTMSPLDHNKTSTWWWILSSSFPFNNDCPKINSTGINTQQSRKLCPLRSIVFVLYRLYRCTFHWDGVVRCHGWPVLFAVSITCKFPNTTCEEVDNSFLLH